jgi:hypothetical protein
LAESDGLAVPMAVVAFPLLVTFIVVISFPRLIYRAGLNSPGRTKPFAEYSSTGSTSLELSK